MVRKEASLVLSAPRQRKKRQGGCNAATACSRLVAKDVCAQRACYKVCASLSMESRPAALPLVIRHYESRALANARLPMRASSLSITHFHLERFNPWTKTAFFAGRRRFETPCAKSTCQSYADPFLCLFF